MAVLAGSALLSPEPEGGWGAALAALPARRVLAVGPDRAEWRLRDTGGSGVPLLLLPGSLGTADVFVRQLLDPPGGARVIAVDYPAGANPVPLAAGLWSLLDTLGIGRAHVLGSSFAAFWLQHAAFLEPNRLGTLFLCCGFVDGSAVAGNPLFDLSALQSMDGETLKAQWVGRLAVAQPTPLSSLQSLLLAEQPGETLRSRLLGAAEAMAALPVPAVVRTVLLEGSDDPLIPQPARAALRAHIAHAETLVIESGGHYPHVIAPDAFGQAVADRLSTP